MVGIAEAIGVSNGCWCVVCALTLHCALRSAFPEIRDLLATALTSRPTLGQVSADARAKKKG